MTYSLPTLSVFVPKSTGDYLVQRYMENPDAGFAQATGNPIRISSSDFSKHGADALLEILGSYATQPDLGVSSLDRASSVERQRILSQYIEVVIKMLPQGELELHFVPDDSEASNGGQVEESLILPPPIDTQRLIGALCQIAGGGNRGTHE